MCKQMTRNELAALVQRLSRKHRLLKRVLEIKTKRQHKNVTYKALKGIRQYQTEKEPRSLTEYLRCGKEIQRLTNELSEMRKARQSAAQTARETKALMALNTEEKQT